MRAPRTPRPDSSGGHAHDLPSPRLASAAPLGPIFLGGSFATAIALAVPFALANPDPLALAGLALLFPVLFNLAYMAGLHIRYLRHQPGPLESPSPDAWPAVTVIIPSRNEPYDVARMTFDSAAAQDYPGEMEIIVVDNSDEDHPDLPLWRHHVERSALHAPSGRQYRLIHRAGTEGFKPRNLDIGVAASESPWLLLLDVDSSLPTNALRTAIAAAEARPRLGFLQLETRPANAGFNRLTMALGVVQQIDRAVLGIRAQGAFPVFYGHNGLWRRVTLEAIGGWEEKAALPDRARDWAGWAFGLGRPRLRTEPLVTEDLAASLRALDREWEGGHLWLATGEWVPASWRELEGQWLRWSVGTLQIAVHHGRRAMASVRLNLLQKVDLAQHVMFYISRGLVPAFVIGGLVTGSPFLAWLALFGMVVGLPAWVGWFRRHGGRRRDLGAILLAAFPLGALTSLIVGQALLRFVLRRPQGWRPTGKAVGRRPALSSALGTSRVALTVGLLTLVLVSWRWSQGMSPLVLLPHLGFGVSLMLAVALFGTCFRSPAHGCAGARIP